MGTLSSRESERDQQQQEQQRQVLALGRALRRQEEEQRRQHFQSELALQQQQQSNAAASAALMDRLDAERRAAEVQAQAAHERRMAALRSKHTQESTAASKKEEDAERQLVALQATAAKQQEQLQAGAQERARRIAFVNGLRLRVSTGDGLLLLGRGAAGKRSFLWLLGQGDQPSKAAPNAEDTLDDVLSMQSPSRMRLTVRKWSAEEILKGMVVILSETGRLPGDVLLLSHDRMELPLQACSALGLRTPLITVFRPDALWRGLRDAGHVAGASAAAAAAPSDSSCMSPESAAWRLLPDAASGVRRVDPPSALSDIYDLEAQKLSTRFDCQWVTHHDDLAAVMAERRARHLPGLSELVSQLGPELRLPTDEGPLDATREALFKLLFLFHAHYKGDVFRFMQSATLDQYDHVAPMTLQPSGN